jgi:hypothetical protein
MSYEQKYLKYKQKYQELKKQLDGGAHNLEIDTYSEMPDFSLTDTPNDNSYLGHSQYGGFNADTLTDYILSDTPTEKTELRGGAPLVMADYTPSLPSVSCSGQVNPIPMVGGNDEFNTTDLSEIQHTDEMADLVGGENDEFNTTTDLSEIQKTDEIAKIFGGADELNITTDLSEIQNTDESAKIFGGANDELNESSEIQNTDDIFQLFSQYGGKHTKSSSSSSSSGSSSDSDFSDSDSF